MLQGILPSFSGLAELPSPVQQFLQSHAFILREPQLVDDLQQKRRSEGAADAVAEQSGGLRQQCQGPEGKAGVQRVSGLQNLQLQDHQKQYESRDSEMTSYRWRHSHQEVRSSYQVPHLPKVQEKAAPACSVFPEFTACPVFPVFTNTPVLARFFFFNSSLNCLLEIRLLKPYPTAGTLHPPAHTVSRHTGQSG